MRKRKSFGATTTTTVSSKKRSKTEVSSYCLEIDDEDRLESSLIPVNLVTGKPYTGNNAHRLHMHMRDHGIVVPIFATYKQYAARGMQVKKGAKSVGVHWFHRRDENDKIVKDDDNDKKSYSYSAIGANLFNIAKDVVIGDESQKIIDEHLTKIKRFAITRQNASDQDRNRSLELAIFTFLRHENIQVGAENENADFRDEYVSSLTMRPRNLYSNDKTYLGIRLSFACLIYVKRMVAKWKKTTNCNILHQLAVCQILRTFGCGSEYIYEIQHSPYWNRFPASAAESSFLVENASRLAWKFVAIYHTKFLYPRENLLAILLPDMPIEILQHIISFVPDYPICVTVEDKMRFMQQFIK